MIVQLSWLELTQAAFVGCQRRIEALQRGRGDRYGYDADGWGTDIEGAAAEMAYAKATNRYWLSVVEDPRELPGDVGPVQIRSTARADGCLILHPDDADDARFVLATGCAPTFTFAGWGIAGELKRDEYWRNGIARPAFFVPQEALRP
jgi:hypothetical protein